MSDRKFTLIELHLDGDTQFGPRTISDALPFGASGTADEETDIEEFEIEEEDEEGAAADDSGGPGAIGALVVLAVLVAAGVAVKKFRGGDEEELEEEEQPDVIVN